MYSPILLYQVLYLQKVFCFNNKKATVGIPFAYFNIFTPFCLKSMLFCTKIIYLKVNKFCALSFLFITVPLKCLKGTGGRDKRDSFFVPHRKALCDVKRICITLIFNYKNVNLRYFCEFFSFYFMEILFFYEF